MFWAYRFSYIRKLQNQAEIENTNAWIQGAYFYEAISVALSNAFSKQKISYRDKPFEFNLKNENSNPKQQKQIKINPLEEKLKARARQVEKLLGGEEKKNGK